MALIKREKSVLYSFSKSLPTVAAGTRYSIGTVRFNRNEPVKIRSVQFYFSNGTEAYMQGIFLDEQLSNVQINPMSGFFGITNADIESPSFSMAHSRKVYFENYRAWAIQFLNFVTQVATTGKYVTVDIEVLEEEWVDENKI